MLTFARVATFPRRAPVGHISSPQRLRAASSRGPDRQLETDRMATTIDFDSVVIDGPTCPNGHELTYAPAIQGGTYSSAFCETCNTGEPHFQVDGFSLWCPDCDFFVTTYVDGCPNNPEHRLLPRPN